MKIALLSDIHANITAFEAVMNQIERDGIDQIIIAGDIVGYYYYPDKVIDICSSKSNIYCIKGNHDRDFLRANNDQAFMEEMTIKYGHSYEISKQKLSDKQINWLEGLPSNLEIEIDNNSFTIAHGSTSSMDEYIYPTESDSKLSGQLSSSKYTILGHTHYPFSWCKNERWLINPGSVGQPRDQSAMSSYYYLDLSNGVLIPKKNKFSIDSLLNDIKQHDRNMEYLFRVLTRN